jgi:hypothetical protein
VLLRPLSVMNGMNTSTNRIFTIEVDGRPTVVFEANSWGEAQELAREKWFRADLSVQTSAGAPLSRASSIFRARNALPEEMAAFEEHRSVLDRDADDLELISCRS